MAKKSDTRRFNLVLPEELLDRIEEMAEEENTSMVEIFRRFIKLGFLVNDTLKQPDSALILREGDNETQIIFL